MLNNINFLTWIFKSEGFFALLREIYNGHPYTFTAVIAMVF